MRSFGTNYIPNEHGDFKRYCPYAIPSAIMPLYSYSASLLNQTKTPIVLSRERAHLALFMDFP